MDFTAFCDSISSNTLRQVALHWYNAGAGKHMPAWPDIRPSAISSALPIVWSYKFEQSTGTFMGRLAGDRITQIFGKSLRGFPLGDIHPPESFSWAYALCMRVVSEPAMYRGYGRIFQHLGRGGLGERIMLPLATDGITCDGILGATEYRYERVGDCAKEVSEKEMWVSLRPARNPARVR